MTLEDENPVEASRAYDPRAKLHAMITALREPAGTDPRFSDIESIRNNRADFIKRVHTTWKLIHTDTIREIVEIEILLAHLAGSTANPKEFISWLRYVSRLWRRVNDAIAWVMIGESHVIRRLCAYRARPTLIESNPHAIAKVLDDLNTDPRSVAIWNDATTCLDVGDITCRRGTGELDFLEVKQGKVNEAIFNLHDTLRASKNAGDPSDATKAMNEFFDSYGKKGFEQATRMTKQAIRDLKIMDIIRNDKGRDPDLDINITIVESSKDSESYDPELTDCLRRAEQAGAATACIDGCLWIFASAYKTLSRQAAITEFSRRVFQVSPQTQSWLLERTGKGQLNPVGTVDQWSFIPTAIPIFLRALDVDDALDLVYGKHIGRVFLFFDWLRFEHVVKNVGCDLTWIRPRQVAGRYIEEIVGKRTPRIGRSNGRGIRVGGLLTGQMLANGVKPSSVAAQWAEMIDRADLG